MDFKRLTELIVAVWAWDIHYDYLKAILTMRIKPNYGFDKHFEDKQFTVTFTDCIYISADNTSILSQKGKTEFIGWGEKPQSCCSHGKFCITIEKLLWRNNNEAGRRVSNENKKQYHHYFFTNGLGDNIDIIAKGVSISQVK